MSIGALRLYTFIFFTGNCSLVTGQAYSLQDCIRIAIEKNIDIQVARLNIENARLQHLQAKYNLLPSLNIGTGVNYNIGYSISPLDYSYIEQNSLSGSVNISSQVTLFQGFQQLRNIQKTEIDYNAGSYQIHILENSIKIQVINLYLQAVMEWEMLNILNRQYQNNLTILSKKREAVENGLIAKTAYREQQLQLTIDEANKSRQGFQLENAINKLKIQLQIPIIQKFQIDTNFHNTDITNYENYEYFDFKSFYSMPELGLERMKLLSSEKQVEIQKGSLYPTLTFGYALGSNFINTKKTYQYQAIKNPVIGYVNDSQRTYVRSLGSQNVPVSENGVPIFTQISDNKQHQFQLNLQWQIFGKGMKRTNVKLAEIATKQQEIRIKLTEQKLKENYFQALSNVLTAYKKVQSNTTVYSAQKERYQLAKDKFENNVIDYFEFSSYQNQLFNSELELSKAKLEWYFNKEILRLYQ